MRAQRLSIHIARHKGIARACMLPSMRVCRYVPCLNVYVHVHVHVHARVRVHVRVLCALAYAHICIGSVPVPKGSEAPSPALSPQ
eukprot:11460414-Alexandrium_andersonii.AAC.1